MSCVLFAKMDQVFSKENKTLQNSGKLEKILEKSGNFVSPEKWEPWLSSTSLAYLALKVTAR